jgi:hypothetical protein
MARPFPACGIGFDHLVERPGLQLDPFQLSARDFHPVP